MSDGVKLDEPIDRISSGRTTRLSEDAIGLLAAAIDAVSITSASILATGTYVLLAGNGPPNTDAHLGLGIVAAILFVRREIDRALSICRLAWPGAVLGPGGRELAARRPSVRALPVPIEDRDLVFARHGAAVRILRTGLPDCRAHRLNSLSAQCIRASEGRAAHRGDRRSRPDVCDDRHRAGEALRNH